MAVKTAKNASLAKKLVAALRKKGHKVDNVHKSKRTGTYRVYHYR